MDPFRMDPFTYAEYMKVQGNQDFKNGCYSMAIKKYDEAIGALTYLCQMGSHSSRDMAVVLCNRSNAFYNLNKWEEALHSARESLQFDATYIKGYYRAGYSLIKLSRTLDAARTFQQGLSILLYPSFRIPESSALISDFLIGIFSTVNNERVITPQFLLICKNAVSGNFSPAIWQQVVEKLAKKGLWQSCLLLSTEKDRLPRSLRVNNLSLKDLFEKYVFFGNYERMERVPKLVEWLISIGANIRSVGTCPLHAVIKLCIKAKGNRLFRWLLDHTPELKDLINQQNEDGSTVLHIVASQISGYTWKSTDMN